MTLKMGTVHFQKSDPSSSMEPGCCSDEPAGCFNNRCCTTCKGPAQQGHVSDPGPPAGCSDEPPAGSFSSCCCTTYRLAGRGTCEWR